MSYNQQRLSLGLVGILLLITASCSGTGENEQRDRPIQDDPTKPLSTAITGKVIAECLGHEDTVRGVAISPDGKLAVSASSDRTLRFWSVPDGKLIRTIHAAKQPNDFGCTGPHFSADGKTVAALVWTRENKSDRLCFWEVATGKELPRSVRIEGRGIGWDLSPDGERVARVIDIDCVRVWDTCEGKLAREFRIRKEEQAIPNALSFSPDAKLLAVGLFNRPVGIPQIPSPPSVSSLVRVWDHRTGQLVFASEAPLTRAARTTVMGPDGEWEYPPEQQPTATDAVAFSPDGTHLAASGGDYGRGTAIWVWDVTTKKLEQKLTVGESIANPLAFSPDGHMLACGASPNVQVWNVTSGKLLGTLEKHTGTIFAVAWAKDGRTLLSCGQDHRVLIWRLEPR